MIKGNENTPEIHAKNRPNVKLIVVKLEIKSPTKSVRSQQRM